MGERVINIFRTLAHAPKALTRFQQWGAYVLSRRNSLPAREREIVILRTGFLCKSGYEFTQHTAIGMREGLTDEEIAAIKKGADAGWTRRRRGADPRRPTSWSATSVRQRRDLGRARQALRRKAVHGRRLHGGQYTQVSMFLNTSACSSSRGPDPGSRPEGLTAMGIG